MTKLLSKRTVAAAWCSCVLAAVLLCAGVAWADEGQESSKPNNHVYVNQLSDSSFLYQTTIADLAQADSYYEGQTVLVQGEAVGDRINDEMQPDNCWVTLQDDDPTNPSVVSVFMTMEQAKNIDTYGTWKRFRRLPPALKTSLGWIRSFSVLVSFRCWLAWRCWLCTNLNERGRCNGNSSRRNRSGGEAR